MATSVLLLCLLAIVQVALWFHASHVAAAAAQEGARSARLAEGSAAAGEGKARDFLHLSAGGLLTDLVVSARRDRDSATVEVRGHVISLLPGFHPPVQAVSSGPVESFRG